MTCVFPLSLAVYIHPVLFARAFRFVENRCNNPRVRGGGLLTSDRWVRAAAALQSLLLSLQSSTRRERLLLPQRMQRSPLLHDSISPYVVFLCIRHLELFFLSHLCWSFLVAEMQLRPFFLSLLDCALAVSSPPVSEGLRITETAACGSEGGFHLPWGLMDVAGTADTQETAAARGRETTFSSASCCFGMSLTPLDYILYRNHCNPTALLQQVSRLLQLETPQLVAASTQQEALKAHAGALMRWKTERRATTQRFLREVKGKGRDRFLSLLICVLLWVSLSFVLSSSCVSFAASFLSLAPDVAAAGSLDWREASDGGPPSPAPGFGHQWPFSEVSLWVGGRPLVLMDEDEGLRQTANPKGSQRIYNTGHKYLLLRAFRALGVPKVSSSPPYLAPILLKSSIPPRYYFSSYPWRCASLSSSVSISLLLPDGIPSPLGASLLHKGVVLSGVV